MYRVHNSFCFCVIEINQSFILIVFVFFSQLAIPQQSYSIGQTAWYGFKWILNLLLIEALTHFFYYNAFAIR